MAGKQWERGGEWHSSVQWVNKQQQQHVSHSSRSGWDGSRAKKEKEKKKKNECETVSSPGPPSRFLLLLSTQCCSKLCTIVCLGRLSQGGAPPLVFVQPVRELLGPSDLSLLEILSPFCPGQVITFREVVHMAWEYNKKKNFYSL